MEIVILPGLDGTGKLVSEFEQLFLEENLVTSIQYPADLLLYDDLLDWVSKILPTDDYILVAESSSGPLAVMIAANKPLGLRGIVFVASFARAPTKLPAALAYALEVIPLTSRLLARAAQPFVMGRWSTGKAPGNGCDCPGFFGTTEITSA